MGGPASCISPPSLPKTAIVVLQQEAPSLTMVQGHLIPYFKQCPACRRLCIPPWMWSLRPSPTHHSGPVECCYEQHNILHSLCGSFHMWPSWSCSSVKNRVAAATTTSSCLYRANARWAREVRFWFLGQRHQWPVPGLSVRLALFFREQRSSCGSCWWAEDLLRASAALLVSAVDGDQKDQVETMWRNVKPSLLWAHCDSSGASGFNFTNKRAAKTPSET